MPLLPSFLLILGSLLLVLWRPRGWRRAWSVEVTATGLALLCAVLAARGLPTKFGLPLWPAELAGGGLAQFTLTPWSWGLLVSLLAFGLAHVLTSGGAGPAWLAFVGVGGLAAGAASPLAVVLVWALMVPAQIWLSASVEGQGERRRGLPRTRDFAAMILLVAGFVLAERSGPSARAAFALLALAGTLRVSSALAAELPGRNRPPAMAIPTAGAALAALGLAVQGGAPPGTQGLLLAVGLCLVAWGWLGGVLWPGPASQVRAWIVGLSGVTFVVAAGSREPAAFILGGTVLALAAAMMIGGSGTGWGPRLGAGSAALLAVGIPGMAGALLLGLAAPPTGAASALPWLGVIGLGLVSSIFLLRALQQGSEAGAPAGAMPALAAATAVVVAVIIYARLHGLSPAASMGATAASLVVCAAAALAWRRIPQGGRDRMGRGLRWPRSARVSRGTAAALAPVEGFVRGVRDVLEGDAALLWALVVVVVGLLLLRAAV